MIFLSLLPILVKARESSVHPPFPAETVEGKIWSNVLCIAFTRFGNQTNSWSQFKFRNIIFLIMIFIEDVRYYLVSYTSKMTWVSAREQCRFRNMTLALPRSTEENGKLLAFMVMKVRKPLYKFLEFILLN